MKNLRSGLTLFEPSDTVKREAQNANIEVMDRLFNSNIAKYKKVTVTGGKLTGNPTTPFTFQTGSPGDNHMWEIPKETALPQSITVHLGREFLRLEGFSFGSWVGSDQSTVPKSFNVEISQNGSEWIKVYEHSAGTYMPFTFLPFLGEVNGYYVRLNVTEHSVSVRTVVSCISVYSRFHGNVDLDPLDDGRSWGLNARTQGLMIIPEGQIKDYGGGKLGIDKNLIVMNPAAGTFFRVNPGTYELPEWGYLYVDIPHRHAQHIDPKIGKWVDGDRGYDNKDRIIIAQRNGYDDIFMNSAIKAKIAGVLPDADKVDGIDLRTNNGYLEFNDGTGWRSVSAVKKVQRGVIDFFQEPPQRDVTTKIKDISPVNLEKAVLTITQAGYNDNKINTSVRAFLKSSSQIEFKIMDSPYYQYFVHWEVIEYV